MLETVQRHRARTGAFFGALDGGLGVWRRGALLPLCILALISCTGPATSGDVQPLPGQPRSSGAAGTVPSTRYELLELDGPARADDAIVFVAFSGGGKRSSAFSYGVLEGMRSLKLGNGDPAKPQTLLDAIDIVTGVSGGSFTAAGFGLHKETFFDRYKEDFLYDQTGARVADLYFLPWKWGWMFSSDYDRSDAMAEVYDELLFKGATFRDLHAAGRPLVVIGATDIVLGTSFIFTQRQFDLLCADLNSMQVARAVAASNAFPGLFSSITLPSFSQPCGRLEPDWLEPLARVKRGELSRVAAVAERYRRYLDPRINYVHLMDGGIADNLGLRALINAVILFNNIQDLPGDSEYLRVRRILFLSGDGEASADLDLMRSPEIAQLEQLFSAVSGTQIDRYNQETLLLASLVMEDFRQQIARLRCKHAASIDGHPCDAVQAHFVHLSLRDLASHEESERLSKIPTGLSVAPEDIDALAEAGRKLVTTSPEVQAFIGQAPVTRSGR
ncbi:MAG: patatin-like phospholipase family protein [Alphaproteobacteria bacterium]|nr:patatin-like phospholipase family protein [Alphaproteobacteria bacterium]MDX5370160.1 patatin-like phospholipase family protein [Alphaproteobacteria bacterium]MDX5464717.1 patatin-like phospholipase family protein [Alphaproteobacteria bacterium]